jgi:hypothetical protein
MSTKIQMQSEIERLERQTYQLSEQLRQEKERADRAEKALNEVLPEFEKPHPAAYPASKRAVWHGNDKIRDAAAVRFQNLMNWAARNLGYGDTEEVRQATGLALLVHLRVLHPSQAVLFASAVCEEQNFRGEAARLYKMYQDMTAPYQNWPHQSTTVNWWAE